MASNGGRKRKHSDGQSADQFDASIPKNLNIVKFAESRAQEIASLSQHVQTKTVNKMVLETLPKHMNRRAMGHDIRRWPRRLRMMVTKQYENQPNKRSRRPPSRKHRRRPQNLLDEYNRRRKKNVWLETHIWHAKRFRMTKKWGYHLALQPNAKSGRMTYRSTVKYCLLQDVSFLCCIEVSGLETEIKDGFAHLCHPATGPGMAAKSYLSGSREGSVVLYAYDQYPNGAIGPVTFLWKPHSTDQTTPVSCDTTYTQNSSRQLWLWCHPSCYSQLWEELVKIFPNIIIPNIQANPASTKDIEDEKLDPKNSVTVATNEVVGSGTPELVETSLLSSLDMKEEKLHVNIPNGTVIKEPHNNSSRVFLRSLKDQLVRFRLTGPLTLKVLTNALDVAHVQNDCGVDSGSAVGHCLKFPWWSEYYGCQDHMAQHRGAQNLWRRLGQAQCPAELPPHWVLGLSVRDPRLRLPDKKKHAQPNIIVQTGGSSIEVNPTLSMSPLWEESIRLEVKNTKLSEQVLNKVLSESLVPGFRLHLAKSSSRVPIILIQRPGSRSFRVGGPANTGFGSGCDVVLPVGWGMAFWVALVYQGARVGGLAEACRTSLELGELYFPTDFPDTDAGLKEMTSIQEEKLKIYLNRPPGKRVNFVRLGVPSPFHTNFLALVQDLNGNPDIQNFCVLRNRKKLTAISRQVSCVKGTKTNLVSIASMFENDSLYKLTLVPVMVKMVSKGTPELFSMICVPRKEDLENTNSSQKRNNVKEPLHREKREKNSKEAKGTKRSRLCEIKLKEGTSQLLPLSCTSRRIIGFLTAGKYALAQASGVGIGFCSILGLELLSLEARSTVLVRSVKSQEYRYAELSVMS